MARQKRDIVLLLIAVLGLVLSLYATTLHFKPSADSLCNVNETLNCDKVNKSPWATFLGIPVSVLGVISYLFVFLVVLKKKAIKKTLSFDDHDFNQYFLFLAVVMCCFQLYLTYAEIFWIRAYCIVCIGSQMCTLVLVWLAWKEYRAKKNVKT